MTDQPKKRPWNRTWREIFEAEAQAWTNVPEVGSVVEKIHDWHVKALRDHELRQQGIDPRRDDGVNTAPRDLEDADVESWFAATEANQREKTRKEKWASWFGR